MRLSKFSLLIFMLLASLSIAQTVTVTNPGDRKDVMQFTVALPDSGDTVVSQSIFLGDFYDLTNYPVQVLGKTSTTATVATPYVAAYLNGSLDGTNYIYHIDTLFAKDSTSAYKRTTFDANGARYKYYTVTFVSLTANNDTATAHNEIWYYKRE